MFAEVNRNGKIAKSELRGEFVQVREGRKIQAAWKRSALEYRRSELLTRKTMD